MKKILHKTCLSGVMLALFAILTAMGTAQAKEVTVTQTKFSAVSGKLVNTATGAPDPYISYESAKGNAGTAPGVYSDAIRIYQEGGLFTVKAATGAKIKSITLQSTSEATVSYSIDGATAVTGQSVVKYTDFSINNLNASTILFTNTSTTKLRLNICKLSVTYETADQSGPTTYTPSFKDQTYPIVEGGTKQLDLGTSHPALTFTPADSEIASVSADGLISAKKVGSQEFTATWSGSDDWVAGSAKFTVNVTEKPAPGSYTWSLLTDASLLKAGMQVIIVCTEKRDAISNASNSNNRPVTSVTFADTEKTGINTLSNDVLTLKVGGETGKWTFLTTNYTGTNGYLGNTSTGKKNNYCQVRSSLEPGCYASVSVDASNNSVIKFDAPNSRGILSHSKTSDFYACYSAEQSPIQIFYNTKSADPDAVAKPTITFADNKVTITSAEGTTVRYTTDGTTTPTATVGTEYKDPFTITASCTVKAVAIKDGKTSEVATLEVTYVYANFAEMIAAGAKDGITVNGPITVVYAYKKYLYTYDKDNKGMLLYGTTTTSDQVNGKAYASVTGNYVKTPYVEIADYTLGAKVEGTAIEPTEITIADINKDILFKYVTLKGVKYTPESGKAGTIARNGSTFATYNQFGIELPAEAKYVDLVAVIGIFNDNLQVQPISFTEVAGPEQVAMPVIAPDGGEVFVDTPITLTCATADATIYYTTNSTPPTTASTLYDAATPITLGTAGSATVKAIAVKDGMEASEVATATFTVKDYATPTGLKVLYHGEDANNTSLEVPVNNVYSFSCNDATKIVLKDALEGTIIAELEGPNATYTFDNTDEVMVTVYGANNKYNSTEEKTFTVTVLKWLKEESYSAAADNVTFDLTALATVNSYSDHTVEATEGTVVHSVAGFKFTNDNVTFTVSENRLSGTEPCLRLKKNAYDLSVYEGSRLDITAPGNIKKITFKTTNFASINDAGNDYTFYIDNSTDSKTPKLTNIDNNTCVWVPAYETTNGYFLFSDDNDIASITVEMGSTEATYSVLVPELTFNEDYVYINTYPGAVLYIKKDTKAASAPMRANAYTSEWTATGSHEEMIGNDEPGKYLVKAVSDHDKFPKDMESEVVGFTIDEKGTVTGIEDVEAGAEECEVEYFNLQGVRVMNPTKGIYIRKYGSKVTKVCL